MPSPCCWDQMLDTHKEEELILAHRFRSFSPWPAGSKAERNNIAESCLCHGSQEAENEEAITFWVTPGRDLPLPSKLHLPTAQSTAFLAVAPWSNQPQKALSLSAWEFLGVFQTQTITEPLISYPAWLWWVRDYTQTVDYKLRVSSGQICLN